MPGTLVHSRILVGALVCSLWGCAIPQTRPAPTPTPVHSPGPLLEWLALEEQVTELDNARVLEWLSSIENPVIAADLYTYALLQQQLGTFEGWIRARDAFARLRQSEQLAQGQARLLAVLQDRSQSRINAHIKRRELANKNLQLEQALELAQHEKQLLEQKIQALTDIEAVISTRRED